MSPKKRLRPPPKLSSTCHRRLAELVRVRRLGEEGVEPSDDGSACFRDVAESKVSEGKSPFAWIEQEDPAARFTWLRPVAGPVLACLALSEEPAVRHLSKIPTVENLAVALEATVLLRLQQQDRGHSALEYHEETLTRAAEEQLLEVFASQEQKDRLREALRPLWQPAHGRLTFFRKDHRTYVATNYRQRHDRLLLKLLTRNEGFFRVPPIAVEGTEEQRGAAEAVLAALRERGWSVLSGCGGAGKTYVLGQVARALQGARTANESLQAPLCPLCGLCYLRVCACGFARQSDETRPVRMVFAAPTNRAVAVLRRVLGEGGGVECCTLHSLLLSRHAALVDLLVLDESSMLGAEHGDILVRCPALKRAAFLFVGDDAQLPPVGAGELLRPLLRRAAVPGLTKNLRVAAPALDEAVAAVRAGSARGAAAFAAPPPEDFMTAVYAAAEADGGQVLALRNEDRAAYCGHAIRARRPLEDGRDDYAAGKKQPFAFVPFKDEPVRFMTNEQRPQACRGSLGTVRRCEELPNGAWELRVEVEGEIVQLSAKHLRQLAALLRPAYCITVHDAQGGEFDAVHVLLPPCPRSPLCNLEMLYTGCSRARKRLRLWPQGAPWAAYDESFARPSPERLTPLAHLLA